MAQFQIDAPGFRALAQSASSSHDLKHVIQADEPTAKKEEDEPPPKFLQVWNRIVSKLMSSSVDLSLVAKATLQRAQGAKSMEWVEERMVAEDDAENKLRRNLFGRRGRASSNRSSTESFGSPRKHGRWKVSARTVIASLEAVAELQLKAQQRTTELARENEAAMMREATKSVPGESRTLAEAAASREWREELKPKYQVRSEMLRRWARETPDPQVRRFEGLEGKGGHAWLWRDYDVQQGQRPQASGKQGPNPQSSSIEASMLELRESLVSE